MVGLSYSAFGAGSLVCLGAVNAQEGLEVDVKPLAKHGAECTPISKIYIHIGNDIPDWTCQAVAERLDFSRHSSVCDKTVFKMG